MFPRALLLCAALFVAAGAQAGLEYKWKNVKEPHFGNALFNLYQDRNFTGAIQLAADMEMHKLKSQTDDAELAEVMLELSYGLHRASASKMVQLTSKETITEDFKNHVWFYVAKIRYQRGYFNQAESALANISGALPWELEQQLQAFMALLLMDREKYSSAANILTNMRGKTGGVPFARYNAGVSLLKAKDKDKSIALLEQVGLMQADNEELKNLRDRANLGLGYQYLFDGKSAEAIDRFERVRLKSLSSNEALLGLGWELYNQGKLDRALVAWSELAKGNVGDTIVQEARVAVPYVLSRLDAYGQASEQYDFALNSFKNEMILLDGIISSVKQGSFFERMVPANTEGEKGWNGDVSNLALVQESYYFTQMLARHEFQEAVKNYRDMRYLQARLDEWSNDINVFETSSEQWLRDIQVRSAQFSRATQASKIKELRDRRDAAAHELAEVEKKHDGVALASEKERSQLEMIAQIEARLALDADGARTDSLRSRLRVMKGRVLWDVYSKFNARVFELKNRIKEIDTAITEALSAQEHLLNAAKGAEYFQKSFDPRFTNARMKIEKLRPNITSSIQATEEYLKFLVLQDLEKRKVSLTSFIAQVSFSVGQGFDPGSKK